MRQGILIPLLASWKLMTSAISPSPWVDRMRQRPFRTLLILSMPSKTALHTRVGSFPHRRPVVGHDDDKELQRGIVSPKLQDVDIDA